LNTKFFKNLKHRKNKINSHGAITFQQSFLLGKKLGEGAFSEVKEVRSRANSAELYAAKIVSKSKMKPEDTSALRDEIAILKELNHPHIIKLYEVFDEPTNYFLITELISGGELFDRIVTKTCYNEKEARDVCKILFEAMNYCHDRNVAHRDLKPENLLLVSRDNNMQIKIADFGFAKKVSSEQCLLTQCGTPGYVAPEILRGVAYGTKADMWSLGVIVYILLGGYPPFHEQNIEELFETIKQGQYEYHAQYWKGISPQAKNLIDSLLKTDPRERLSAREALHDSWITGSDDTLAGYDLGNNLVVLKKFNAKRKLRQAVFTVIAANKMTAVAQFNKRI